MLSPAEARRVYDRVGSRQDSQAFYEDSAIELLLRHGDFWSARAVFEFGCGTGRLARRLMEAYLPPEARYHAVDLSPTMVRLARERLSPYSTRATVSLSDGGPPSDEPAGVYDRFLSTYVFDLLSGDDIRATLIEAHRMLRADGLLLVAGLSTGVDPLSRAVARAWAWVHGHRPAAVGGCRPLDLAMFVRKPAWNILFHRKVVAFGIPSEALVARRI